MEQPGVVARPGAKRLHGQGANATAPEQSQQHRSQNCFPGAGVRARDKENFFHAKIIRLGPKRIYQSAPELERARRPGDEIFGGGTLGKGIIPKRLYPKIDPMLSTLFLSRIPLPDIPLPIPAFPATVLALVAVLPRCVLLWPGRILFPRSFAGSLG
jgi:hypothetical protein